MNTLDQADFDAIWKPDMIFLNKGRTFTQTLKIFILCSNYVSPKSQVKNQCQNLLHVLN
jgi:hypothetical protein